MNIPAVSTRGGRTVRTIDHDFNLPLNEGGFYESVLPEDADVEKGDFVRLVGDGIEVVGVVRCLIAVVDPLPPGLAG